MLPACGCSLEERITISSNTIEVINMMDEKQSQALADANVRMIIFHDEMGQLRNATRSLDRGGNESDFSSMCA